MLLGQTSQNSVQVERPWSDNAAETEANCKVVETCCLVLYSSLHSWLQNKPIHSAFRHVDVEKLEGCPSFASASGAFDQCEEKQRKETKEQKGQENITPSGNVMKTSFRQPQISLLIQPRSPNVT